MFFFNAFPKPNPTVVHAAHGSSTTSSVNVYVGLCNTGIRFIRGAFKSSINRRRLLSRCGTRGTGIYAMQCGKGGTLLLC